jgi:imidazolonepropionase-like amidohydrolase
MHLRAHLRSPFGEQLTLDAADGVWAEPSGTPESLLGEDSWALPGLIDAHAHLAKPTMDLLPGDYDGAVTRARDALAAGVMLIIDKGWKDFTVLDVIDQVSLAERPDIEAAGLMHSVQGGYYEGFATLIESGAIETIVAEAADHGRGWVKLVGDWPRKGVGPIPNFSEAELELAVKTAAAGGARVSVHTMAREVPAMAVRAGVQSVEHGLFLSTDDLEVLGQRQGIWVPTLVQVEAIISQIGAGSSGGRLLAEGFENAAGLLNDAVDAGVHVLAGTDLAVATDEVALEAVRLWEMGMPAAEAVRAVSTAGFDATGRPVQFEGGFPADAVFFAENPIVNPKVLAHPEVVIRHGRIVR